MSMIMHFQESFIQAIILNMAGLPSNQNGCISTNNKELGSIQVDDRRECAMKHNFIIGGTSLAAEFKFISMELFKYFRVIISRSVILMFVDGKYSYNSYEARIAGR